MIFFRWNTAILYMNDFKLAFFCTLGSFTSMFCNQVFFSFVANDDIRLDGHFFRYLVLIWLRVTRVFYYLQHWNVLKVDTLKVNEKFQLRHWILNCLEESLRKLVIIHSVSLRSSSFLCSGPKFLFCFKCAAKFECKIYCWWSGVQEILVNCLVQKMTRHGLLTANLPI